MFESVQQCSRCNLVRKVISLLVSAAMHSIAILFLVFLPLVFFNVLPELDLVTFLIAAPPPPAPIPPPPPPAGDRVTALGRQVIADFSIQPTTIPDRIPEPDSRDLEVPDSYSIRAVPTASPYGVPAATPGPGLAALFGPIIAPPPPLVAPRPTRAKAQKVGGVVLDGMVMKRVEPGYPPLARMARVSGTVILQVRIDEEGNVEAVDVLSGHPLLVEAAVTAVRQWKYSPTLLNGEPVPVIGTVKVVFNLK
jgi:protein TonB